MPIYQVILKFSEYELVEKFNHNHAPKGSTSPKTGRKNGGKFTSFYVQALDGKGKPMYDKYGKAVHALDKDGNKIPKPPGGVRI